MPVVERSTNTPMRSIAFEYNDSVASSDLNESQSIIINNIIKYLNGNITNNIFKLSIHDFTSSSTGITVTGMKYLAYKDNYIYYGYLTPTMVLSTSITPSTNDVFDIYAYYRTTEIGIDTQVYASGIRTNSIQSSITELEVTNNVEDPILEEVSLRKGIEFTFVVVTHNSVSPVLENWSTGVLVSTITYKSSSSFELINKAYPFVVDEEIAQMKTTFQDGVDTIYNAIVANGVTPSSSTPTACATGINKLISDIYGAIVNNGVTPSAYTDPACVTAINNIRSGGDATAAQILNGKKAYVNKSLVTGTMPNKVSPTVWSSTNNVCNASSVKEILVPEGYHGGTGKVSFKSLADQTRVDSGKTAVGAGQMLTNYQGWVNGSKVSGTMADKGAWTGTGTPSGNNTVNVTIPAGYHNGSGYVTADGRTAYSTGVNDGIATQKAVSWNCYIGVDASAFKGSNGVFSYGVFDCRNMSAIQYVSSAYVQYAEMRFYRDSTILYNYKVTDYAQWYSFAIPSNALYFTIVARLQDDWPSSNTTASVRLLATYVCELLRY